MDINGNLIVGQSISGRTANLTTAPTTNNTSANLLVRNSTTGNIEQRTFSFQNQSTTLDNWTAFSGSTGMVAQTAAGTWVGRTITASSGITISNGSGTAGNPTVALQFSALTALNFWSAGTGSAALVIPNKLNTASGDEAIAVGARNQASGKGSFAGGSATVPFTTNAVASGTSSFAFTTTSVVPSFGIAAGAYAPLSVVIGGYDNIVYGGSQESAIIGGNKNRIIDSGDSNGILGGNSNAISSTGGNNAMLGGNNNTLITGVFGSVAAGGSTNTITNSSNSIVLGGNNNRASANSNAIIAGTNNTVSNTESVIVGGISNSVSCDRSVMLGGSGNTISGNGSDNVVMGKNNKAIGTSCLAVGNRNTASGTASFVMGQGNVAGGFGSFAGGFPAAGGLNTNVAVGSTSFSFQDGYTGFWTPSFSGGVYSSRSAILGGRENLIANGGEMNGIFSSSFSRIFGFGSNNVIIGGNANFISGSSQSVIIGGNFNTIFGGGACTQMGSSHSITSGTSLTLQHGVGTKGYVYGERTSGIGSPPGFTAQEGSFLMATATTNATSTILGDGSGLAGITIPNNESWIVNYKLHAVITSVTNRGKTRTFEGKLRVRNNAGTLTVTSLGTGIADAGEAGTGAFTFTPTNVSGTSWRMNVVGAASTSVNWLCKLDYTRLGFV